MLFGLDKMIDKVLPPDTPEGRWRTIITLFSIALAAATLVGWGLVPGLQGFAQTVTVQSVEHKLEEVQRKTDESIARIEATQSVILVRLIASDLEAARASQCKALEDKNTGAAQGWRTRLDASLYEYRVSSGREYPLRGCGEY